MDSSYTTIPVIIAVSHGAKAVWDAITNIIPSGVLIFETDTRQIKITDGVTPYQQLEYVTERLLPSEKQMLVKVGTPNGVLQLDSNGKISNAFLPDPSGIATASETQFGIVKRASDIEASAGLDTSKYITAAQLVTNITSALTQFKNSILKYCTVYGGPSIQTIPPATQTLLEGYQTIEGENWAANNGTLGIIVPESGVYNIRAHISPVITNPSTAYGHSWLRRNGVNINSSLVYSSASNAGYCTMYPDAIIQLQANDLIQVVLTLVNGGSIGQTSNRILKVTKLK